MTKLDEVIASLGWDVPSLIGTPGDRDTIASALNQKEVYEVAKAYKGMRVEKEVTHALLMTAVKLANPFLVKKVAEGMLVCSENEGAANAFSEGVTGAFEEAFLNKSMNGKDYKWSDIAQRIKETAEAVVLYGKGKSHNEISQLISDIAMQYR